MANTKTQPKEKQAEAKKQERKKRVPLGAQRIKGIVENKDPNYHYHFINDKPGRLQAAIDGGYEFVPKEGVEVGTTGDMSNNLGSMVSQYAGRDEAGQPYNRYLMRIRNEFYDEDFAAKQAVVDETDRAIQAGKFKRSGSKEEYVPKDGIKIKSGDKVA